MSTTIEVSENALVVWRKWCRLKKMTSIELMNRLQKEVTMKHQQKFYNSLPDPRLVKTDKPLKNISLSKNYRKKCF